MIPKLILMVGLPGSGKTSKAEELAIEHNAKVFSSDKLRLELFGDVDHQTDNDKLFKELHKRIKDCLKSGQSAIYDATNLSYKYRKAFLDELKSIPCEKICVVMATPYEKCLELNQQRDRKVPKRVMEKMYKSFTAPWWYEGWDKIDIEYFEGSKNSYGKTIEWIRSVEDFNQDNPHHELTLGTHCYKTASLISFNCDCNEIINLSELIEAALLHDCGKVFTKVFKNSKGEPTDIAHYYSHEKRGSYNSLFYDLPTSVNHLYVATLIQWHMQPYYWEKDNNIKSQEKYRKLWGDELYNDIMILHKADKEAH